jgi:hypothetical protein
MHEIPLTSREERFSRKESDIEEDEESKEGKEREDKEEEDEEYKESKERGESKSLFIINRSERSNSPN